MSKTKTKKASGSPLHIPVMTQEVLEYLSPQKGDDYLDVTAGFGGHAAAVSAAAGRLGKVTLVDRDDQAATALTALFPDAEIVHSDFASASQELVAAGRQFQMILADLGASSLHLGEAGRGFSFSRSGPLDMRMDQRQSVTADELINHSTQDELERILTEYGQEHRAKTIAAAIFSNRPLSSTDQLATVVVKAVGRRWRDKIHPATKTFQALRIAVNDELAQLEKSLPLWLELLAPGGRLAVISFHSLEDRLVKDYLKDHSGNTYDAELTLLTKKPLTAQRTEIVSNPRARSAKLRAAAKK